MTIVDVHSHQFPAFVKDIIERRTREHGLVGDSEYLDSEAGRLPLHYSEMHTPQAKLAAMDLRGVDESIVSLTPHLFVYAKEHDPVRFAVRCNDSVAEFVSASPRLHGLATLPIGHPAEATEELRRSVSELGLVGAIIGTGLSSHRPLDGLDIDPIFSAAEELGVPLLLHPSYCGLITSPEMFLNNSLGVPFDTAWTVARLMASGALDRHPHLRLVLPHGGGALPYVLGRLDNAWHSRDTLNQAAKKQPSGYGDQLWYDSIVHSPIALRFLTEFAGTDRVLLGTDSPYLTGDASPVTSFAQAGLDPAKAGDIAQRLFNLPRRGFGVASRQRGSV